MRRHALALALLLALLAAHIGVGGALFRSGSGLPAGLGHPPLHKHPLHMVHHFRH